MFMCARALSLEPRRPFLRERCISSPPFFLLIDYFLLIVVSNRRPQTAYYPRGYAPRQAYRPNPQMQYAVRRQAHNNGAVNGYRRGYYDRGRDDDCCDDCCCCC